MIFVSAGHYPASPGARYGRFIEHDEAVVWAERLVEELGGDGTLVPTGFLREKVDFINKRILNGDIAIEIHFNAAKNSSGENVGRGCETLYYPGSDKGRELAEVCQSALAVYFSPDRGVKEGWYRMDPDRGPDFFLAKTVCPAAILEPEFVHRNELITDFRESTVALLAERLKLNYKGETDGITE